MTSPLRDVTHKAEREVFLSATQRCSCLRGEPRSDVQQTAADIIAASPAEGQVANV